LDEFFPQLAAGVNRRSTNNYGQLLITEKAEKTDLAFVCLPHTAAAATVVELLAAGVKVVDLSADFRLRDPAVYARWYKHEHPAPALLETAVFGLPERYRTQIAQAQLVANPGCHVTTAVLGLLPALAAGIVGPDLVTTTLTGISGAGRSLKLDMMFCEQDEDISAYSLAGHRHLPEIVQELEAGAMAGGHPQHLRLTFTPHLVPISRGLLATSYGDLVNQNLTQAELLAIYAEYYADEPFVRVLETPPHSKWTTGTNLCLVHPTIDQRTGRLVVVSCLDNLGKGAASQAVQNANLLAGLPEATGLPQISVYP
jgi:N-acetyl-gamma-glutamyl-phosphate reductase